jgi:hypothetical protein
MPNIYENIIVFDKYDSDNKFIKERRFERFVF